MSTAEVFHTSFNHVSCLQHPKVSGVLCQVVSNKLYHYTVLQPNNEFLAEDSTSLWIVSKELQAGKIFSDYFGKNEKQKFIAKLQKKGAGAPQREPTIDGETHKSMLSYYHKKQDKL